MINATKHREDLLEILSNDDPSDEALLSLILSEGPINVDLRSWCTDRNYRYTTLLAWLLQEEKKNPSTEMLTQDEKAEIQELLIHDNDRYKISYIQKCCMANEEFVRVVYVDMKYVEYGESVLATRSRPLGTRFKGIKLDKKYSLEELEI